MRKASDGSRTRAATQHGRFVTPAARTERFLRGGRPTVVFNVTVKMIPARDV